VLNLAKKAAKNLLNRYPARLCRQEFEEQTDARFNERPIEYGFVMRKLGEIYPRTVLDVGTGTTALPLLMRNCGCLVTATDNVRDYWPSGMLNRHYHIIDDDITDTQLVEKFDLITCISVLEHIQKPDDAIRNMFVLLKPDGHLIITCPYNERTYIENVYELPGSSYGKGLPYVTQAYSRMELDRWLKNNQGIIVEQEYWQFWEGEQWTVGEQLIPPRQVAVNDKHQLTCILMRKGQGPIDSL
jgi:2-polyprenyl-3-methyl-5-hydroxy-6-metoxy-1,4-benzoquinol methylase